MENEKKVENPKFKMVLLGESRCGKTSFLNRLVRGEFLESVDYRTEQAKFVAHSERYNKNTIIDYEIWDTGGNERYRGLAPMYYKGSDVCFVMYDVSVYESYNAAKSWVRELKRELQNFDDVIIVLLGNKRDLYEKRQVLEPESNMYSEDNDILFFETSAKTGLNIHEIFSVIGKQLLKDNDDMYKEMFTPKQQTQVPRRKPKKKNRKKRVRRKSTLEENVESILEIVKLKKRRKSIKKEKKKKKKTERRFSFSMRRSRSMDALKHRYQQQLRLTQKKKRMEEEEEESSMSIRVNSKINREMMLTVPKQRQQSRTTPSSPTDEDDDRGISMDSYFNIDGSGINFTPTSLPIPEKRDKTIKIKRNGYVDNNNNDDDSEEEEGEDEEEEEEEDETEKEIENVVVSDVREGEKFEPVSPLTKWKLSQEKQKRMKVMKKEERLNKKLMEQKTQKNKKRRQQIEALSKSFVKMYEIQSIEDGEYSPVEYKKPKSAGGLFSSIGSDFEIPNLSSSDISESIVQQSSVSSKGDEEDQLNFE